MHRTVVPPLVLCLLSCLPLQAKAQPEIAPSAEQAADTRDEEARSAFEAGRTAFESGRFESALNYFRLSLEASGRPEILFNIGMALDRLNRAAEALEHYQRYLDAKPDAPNRAFVGERMAALRPRVEQQAPDMQAELSPVSESGDQEAGPVDSGPASTDARRVSLTTVGVLSGAGLAVALGTVFLIVGHGQLDDLEARCERGGCADVEGAIDDSGVETSRTVAYVGLGVGAALAAAGATLLAVELARGDRRQGRGVQASVSPAGVVLRGSF